MGSYNKNTWQDRQGIGLNKFTDQNGNEYAFTPNPDSITQTGTPFSADWMNNIENGIKNLDDKYSQSYKTLYMPYYNGRVLAIGQSTTDNGGYINLYDNTGIRKIVIQAGENGTNEQIILRNSSGSSNVIYIHENSAGGIISTFNSSNGNTSFTIGTSTSNNGGFINLVDSDNVTRVTGFAGAANTNASGININGSDGNWRIKLQTDLTSNTQDTISIKSPPTTTASANVAFGNWSGGGYYLTLVSSSRKYKENIETIDDPEQTIKKLNPVKYTDKITKRDHLGYIAEEMAEVCPLLTEYDEEGNPRSVAYDRVNVLLTKAVQDLYKRVEMLEQEVKALKEGN